MTDDALAAAETAADAAAAALLDGTRAHTLAAVAENEESGLTMLSRLLTHELATSHVLLMRVAAEANGCITKLAGEAPGEDGKAGREVARLSGIVARLMERYRLGLLALLKLRDPKNQPPQQMVVNVISHIEHGPDRFGDGGGGSPPDASNTDTPPAEGSPPAAGLGQLHNGNPAGDFTRAPRCGARTRTGSACRQPAMPNGRCRLHGGHSTGPRTAAGLAAAGRARLRHGADTAERIALRAAASRCGRRLDQLLQAAHGRPAWHGVDPTNRPSPWGETPPAASPAPSPAAPPPPAPAAESLPSSSFRLDQPAQAEQAFPAGHPAWHEVDPTNRPLPRAPLSRSARRPPHPPRLRLTIPLPPHLRPRPLRSSGDSLPGPYVDAPRTAH